MIRGGVRTWGWGGADAEPLPTVRADLCDFMLYLGRSQEEGLWPRKGRPARVVTTAQLAAAGPDSNRLQNLGAGGQEGPGAQNQPWDPALCPLPSQQGPVGPSGLLVPSLGRMFPGAQPTGFGLWQEGWPAAREGPDMGRRCGVPQPGREEVPVSPVSSSLSDLGQVASPL